MAGASGRTAGGGRSGSATTKARARSWREAAPAPVVLVTGAEQLLVQRSVERVRDRLRAQDPGLDVVTAEAAGYEPGMLATWTSPSLFAEPRLVVCEGVEQADEPFVRDVTAYLADVQEDVTLVLVHGGGQRGRRLLDAVRATAGAVLVDCPKVTRDSDRHEFLVAELAERGRRATPAAARALLEGVGSDLRALAAACAQLDADLPAGQIDVDQVERYYGGRVEVTGFRVADAVVAGHCEQALGLLRQAVGTGLDPVPLVAAIAAKVRTMAAVATAGRGRSVDVAKGLGLAPWQVDRARRDLAGWTPSGIATAVLALAEADTAVKGGGRDPVYAVERAVVAITRARVG